MKWIGQHIWDLTSRFRNDIYFEGLAETAETRGLVVDANGKVSINPLSGDEHATHIYENVRNDEGATIPVGTPVYSKGEIGGSERIKVGIADASDPAKMPAIGITNTELTTTGDTQDGLITLVGVYNTNLSGFSGVSENDIVYVAVGGGLTITKPTGANLIQNVGIVLKTNGTIIQGLQVTCIGRTNDVPTPLYIDHANQRVGVGVTSPSEKLHVNGGVLIESTNPSLLFTDTNSDSDYSIKVNGGILNVRDETNDTARISLKSNGNVGIGHSSPVSNLHVYENSVDTNSAAGLTIEQAGTGDALAQFLLSGQRRWVVGADNSDDDKFKIASSIDLASDAYLTIDTSGNVGIGITNPAYILDTHSGTTNVAARFKSGDNQAWISVQDDDSGTYGALFGTDSDAGHDIILADRSANKRLVIDTSGNVGIGTGSPISMLHIVSGGSPSITIQDSDGTDQYATINHNNGANQYIARNNTSNGQHVWFGQTGTSSFAERMRIDSSGNVGIGTASPGYRFVVNSYSADTVAKFESTDSIARLELKDDDDAAYVGTQNNKAFIGMEANATGTNNLIVTSDGKVGIGTTSPLRKLHVSGDVEIESKIYGTQTDHTYYQIASGDYNHKFFTRTSTGASLERLRVEGGADVDSILMLNSNVGIGTTSPDSLLHVSADVSSGGVTNTGTITIEGRPAGYLGDDIATIDFHNTGVKYADIRMERGNAGNDSQLVFSTSDTGTLNDALIINEIGWVGIGTNSPSAKLEVTDGNVILRPNTTGAALTWRESDNGNVAGQLRSYGNRGDIYLYKDGAVRTEISSLDDSFIPRLHIGGTTQASEALQVTGNAVITGDLTVQGTTVTIDTTNLNVEDKNITLNYSTGDSSGSADGAGITIQDAVDASNDATMLWNASSDRFDFSHPITAKDSIRFVTSGGTDGGLIDMDSNDDLVISNPLGGIFLGNGTDDIYIGDGTSSVDIRFEQNMSIYADSSTTRTLTLGGPNTNLVLDAPSFSGTVTLGATSINNKLTFTTSNGYINFDYEPSGETGEYSTPTKLLTVSNGSEEEVIMQRMSENGAIMIGHDDIVAIAAGDTWSILRDNIGWTGENVILASEAGFTSYGFPNNDTTWSNRNTFRFYGGSATAADNGLYIGDGSSTQFIDLNRNLKNIGTITANSNVDVYGTLRAHGGSLLIEDTDSDNIHGQINSNSTEGVLRLRNGANWGMIARGIGNSPRLGAYHNGDLRIYGFGAADGADHVDDEELARFSFAGQSLTVYGQIGASGNITTTGNSYIVSSRKFTARDGNGTGLFADDAASGLSIADDGDATFTGDVTTGGNLTINSTYPRIFLTDSNHNDDWSIINNDGKFGVYNDTDTSYALSINGSNNVGIGTTSPHNKAHITSSGNQDGLLLDLNTGSSGDYTGVYFKVDNNTTNAYKKGGLVWERTGSYNEGRFHFLLNNEDNTNNVDLTDSKFTILSTGNVGIGATGPDKTLTINQNADSSGIKINGYDDVSNSNIELRVDSSGTARLKQTNAGGDGYLVLEADNYINLNPGTFTYTSSIFRVYDAGAFQLGNGGDFSANHNGTDTFLGNNTGDLYITQQADDKDIIFRSDDGSGGVETYFFLDGSNGLTTFPDNKKLGFGNASDLRIQHDGSDSYISQVGTGHLYIQNAVDDKDIIFQSDDGSGGVTEYFRVDGLNEQVVFSKNLKLQDNDILRLGDANDLQIYHDGSNSFIDDSGTGKLRIRSNALQLEKYTGENMAVFNADGAASIYYDGSKKLETTSTGVEVTGNINVSGSVQRQISTTHHTFTFGAAGSASQDYWVPFIGSSELASPNVTHRTIAPYGGILKKAIVHSTVAYGTSAQVRFHRIDNGTSSVFTNDNSTDDVTTNVTADMSTAYSSVAFDFTTGNTFSAGDQIGVSFVRDNTGLGDVAITLVWEYELF